MGKSYRRCIGVLSTALVAAGVLGCSSPNIANETVASANGEVIKVREIREFLGVRGGGVPASEVTMEQKKEALDRLIAGRLLAQEARAKGLDNTDAFRDLVEQNKEAALITALFRKEMAGKLTVTGADIREEAKKLRAADNTLSEANADARAGRLVSETKIRQVEESLIESARKGFPASINREVLDRIGKGEKVEEHAVLATVGGENLSYGEVKRQLRNLPGGMHGNQDLSKNPLAVSRILEREITGKALGAYARKEGIEGSEWIKDVRRELERSILIDLLAGNEVLGGAEVTEKEIRDAYEEHAQMFVRNGRKVPLSEIREQIRGFLQNEKRRKSLEEYIEALKKKATITVNETMLSKV